jgi:cobalt-precorrin 5A hydrolase
MIFVGLGCRKGCDAGDILRAIALELSRTAHESSSVVSLYAPEFKRDEPGLVEAAAVLSATLVWLPLALLRAEAPGTLTQSAAVLTKFGIPSIAETAALAGARRVGKGGVRLLGPRVIAGAATCALATYLEEASL